MAKKKKQTFTTAIINFFSSLTIYDGMALLSFLCIVGFAAASMSHVYRFSLLFNEPFFGMLFTIAMELGLVGTTVVYSLRGVFDSNDDKVEEKKNIFEKIKTWVVGKQLTPMQKAKRFAMAAVVVIFCSLYFINVASAYVYFIDSHEVDFITKYAAKLLDVFIIGYLPIDIPTAAVSIFLAHIAAGILPFGGYTFGKLVALSLAQKAVVKSGGSEVSGSPVEDTKLTEGELEKIISDVLEKNKLLSGNKSELQQPKLSTADTEFDTPQLTTDTEHIEEIIEDDETGGVVTSSVTDGFQQ